MNVSLLSLHTIRGQSPATPPSPFPPLLYVPLCFALRLQPFFPVVRSEQFVPNRTAGRSWQVIPLINIAAYIGLCPIIVQVVTPEATLVAFKGIRF